MAVTRSGSAQAHAQQHAQDSGASHTQTLLQIELEERQNYNGAKRRGEKGSVFAAICPRGRPLKVIAAGISLCLVLTVLNVIMAPAHGRIVRQRSEMETKTQVGHVGSLQSQGPLLLPFGEHEQAGISDEKSPRKHTQALLT